MANYTTSNTFTKWLRKLKGKSNNNKLSLNFFYIKRKIILTYWSNVIKIDKRDKLREKPFSYKITKANKTLIYYENRMIKTLNEKETKRLIKKIDGLGQFEVQLALAKITGNFKRVNKWHLN